MKTIRLLLIWCVFIGPWGVSNAVGGWTDALKKTIDSAGGGDQLDNADIVNGLKAAILNQSMVPVLATAATGGEGVRALLDTLVRFAPSPADAGPALAEGAAGEEEIEPNELAPLAAIG